MEKMYQKPIVEELTSGLMNKFGFTPGSAQKVRQAIDGGLPSKNRLKGSYLPADTAIPPVEDDAEQITEALLDTLRPNHDPSRFLNRAGP